MIKIVIIIHKQREKDTLEDKTRFFSDRNTWMRTCEYTVALQCLYIAS